MANGKSRVKVQFMSFKGKPTDVLHSKDFNKMTLRQRENLSFNKDNKKFLRKEDQLLLRGYARRCADINRVHAYHYKKKGK